MTSVLDPRDRDFLQSLNRLGGGTVQEICADLGVTATAVRQRLTRLQASDHVTRETIREGRGRPHHVYRVTDLGRSQLGENYADLARTLWRAIGRIKSPQTRSLVWNNVREELVARYRRTVHAAGTSDRFRQLGIGLAAEGFDVEMDTSGELPILRENNCPYLELAAEDAGICELEQAVFTEVVVAPVSLSQSCRDGSSCCEFRVELKAS